MPWCRCPRTRNRQRVETKAGARRTRVLLADDHAIVLEGLSSLLSAEFELAGTVTDGAQLMEAAERLRPMSSSPISPCPA